jgi:hypothetical protein
MSARILTVYHIQDDKGHLSVAIRIIFLKKIFKFSFDKFPSMLSVYLGIFSGEAIYPRLSNNNTKKSTIYKYLLNPRMKKLIEEVHSLFLGNAG